jgi:hypothetical protein
MLIVIVGFIKVDDCFANIDNFSYEKIKSERFEKVTWHRIQNLEFYQGFIAKLELNLDR